MRPSVPPRPLAGSLPAPAALLLPAERDFSAEPAGGRSGSSNGGGRPDSSARSDGRQSVTFLCHPPIVRPRSKNKQKKKKIKIVHPWVSPTPPPRSLCPVKTRSVERRALGNGGRTGRGAPSTLWRTGTRRPAPLKSRLLALPRKNRFSNLVTSSVRRTVTACCPLKLGPTVSWLRRRDVSRRFPGPACPSRVTTGRSPPGGAGARTPGVGRGESRSRVSHYSYALRAPVGAGRRPLGWPVDEPGCWTPPPPGPQRPKTYHVPLSPLPDCFSFPFVAFPFIGNRWTSVTHHRCCSPPVSPAPWCFPHA